MIREGKLVGEFEEMYRDFEDPWEQTKRGTDELDMVVGRELLKKFGHTRRR